MMKIAALYFDTSINASQDLRKMLHPVYLAKTKTKYKLYRLYQILIDSIQTIQVIPDPDRRIR